MWHFKQVVSLFTEEHETRAKHIVETRHRVLASEMKRSMILQHIFAQMDDCSRENNNRFVFAYVETLMA